MKIVVEMIDMSSEIIQHCNHMYLCMLLDLQKVAEIKMRLSKEVWRTFMTLISYECKPITVLLVFSAILSDSLYNNYDVRQSVADPLN